MIVINSWKQLSREHYNNILTDQNNNLHNNMKLEKNLAHFSPYFHPSESATTIKEAHDSQHGVLRLPFVKSYVNSFRHALESRRRQSKDGRKSNPSSADDKHSGNASNDHGMFHSKIRHNDMVFVDVAPFKIDGKQSFRLSQVSNRHPHAHIHTGPNVQHDNEQHDRHNEQHIFIAHNEQQNGHNEQHNGHNEHIAHNEQQIEHNKQRNGHIEQQDGQKEIKLTNDMGLKTKIVQSESVEKKHDSDWHFSHDMNTFKNGNLHPQQSKLVRNDKKNTVRIKAIKLFKGKSLINLPARGSDSSTIFLNDGINNVKQNDKPQYHIQHDEKKIFGEQDDETEEQKLQNQYLASAISDEDGDDNNNNDNQKNNAEMPEDGTELDKHIQNFNRPPLNKKPERKGIRNIQDNPEKNVHLMRYARNIREEKDDDFIKQGQKHRNHDVNDRKTDEKSDDAGRPKQIEEERKIETKEEKMNKNERTSKKSGKKLDGVLVLFKNEKTKKVDPNENEKSFVKTEGLKHKDGVIKNKTKKDDIGVPDIIKGSKGKVLASHGHHKKGMPTTQILLCAFCLFYYNFLLVFVLFCWYVNVAFQ